MAIAIMKSFVVPPVILMFTLFDWSCALIPVSDESGNGINVPELVTLDTWQYCIVDNSTILRLDTGEQLDIVYTSNNTLVVTLYHSQTAVALPRLHNELACSIDGFSGRYVIPTSIFIVFSVWSAVILAVSGHNIAAHIIKKMLHKPMGKLLMWYSIFLFLRSISIFMLFTLLFKLPADFQYVHLCHFIKLILIAANLGYEAIATCILMHAAYSLHQSHKMQPVDPSKHKIFSRRHFWYVTCTVAISMLVIFTYDVGARKGDYSGYCDRNDPIYHNMVTVMQTVVVTNKVAQIALFIIYLHYWRKLRNSVHVIHHQTDQNLFRIAVGMGATISISEFAYTLSWIISLATGIRSTPVEIIGTMMLILQHCIITGLLDHAYKVFCKKQVAIAN